MKVRHTLICFFFLSLQDGNSGLANAQLTVFTGTEGGDVRVKCSISSSGRRMFFCRRGCQQQDILVETTGYTAERGRYSIEYIKGSLTRGSPSVSITQLTKSDSGRYRCGLGTAYYEFRVSVVDARLDGNPSEGKPLYTRTGGNITVECSFTSSGRRKYFCRRGCEEKDILVETTDVRAQKGRYRIEYTKGSSTGGSLYVSITQLTKSDSGRYRCGLDRRLSQDPYRVFEIIVTDAPTTSKPHSTLPAFSTSIPSASTPTAQSDLQQTPTSGVMLSLVMIVVTTVIILGLALTIICIKRNTKPDGLQTRGNSKGIDMELSRESRSAPSCTNLLRSQSATYENCPPLSASEESPYQSLSPASRDQNQIYSTLTYTQHT